jgi:hypothetical protein
MSRAPHLAYLHFAPSPDPGAASSDQYYADLLHLHELLGRPSGFPFYLVEVEIEPAAAFDRLRHLTKGEPETDREMRAALRGEVLFEFRGMKRRDITG